MSGVDEEEPGLPMQKQKVRKDRCAVPSGECSKYAVMQGFCVSHARVFLDEETFENLHKVLGRCKVNQCEKKAVFRGFCQIHGKENLGDENFKALRRKAGRCKVDNCEKKIVMKGMCTIHARQEIGDEAFDAARRTGGRCKQDGCRKWPVMKGWCTGHARENLPDDLFQSRHRGTSKAAEITEHEQDRSDGVAVNDEIDVGFGITESVGSINQSINLSSSSSSSSAKKSGEMKSSSTIRRPSGTCKMGACAKKAVISKYCRLHAKEMLDPALFERVCKTINRCKTHGCEKKGAVRGYCHTHGKVELGTEEFERVRNGMNRCKESAASAACCTKKAILKGYCITHARTELDPIVFREAYQAMGKCRRDGCAKRGNTRGKLCLEHARDSMGPEDFEKLRGDRQRQRQRAVCKQEGCDKVAKVRGHCKAHAKERASTPPG